MKTFKNIAALYFKSYVIDGKELPKNIGHDLNREMGSVKSRSNE